MAKKSDDAAEQDMTTRGDAKAAPRIDADAESIRCEAAKVALMDAVSAKIEAGNGIEASVPVICGNIYALSAEVAALQVLMVAAGICGGAEVLAARADALESVAKGILEG